ncbi:hypothetical protein I317_01453 [Kwoniella heveanensis CBS 569]|nr:hypothetical protein I317_01453 [Kwoniella heveanensis CBS 569]
MSAVTKAEGQPVEVLNGEEQTAPVAGGEAQAAGSAEVKASGSESDVPADRPSPLKPQALPASAVQSVDFAHSPLSSPSLVTATQPPETSSNLSVPSSSTVGPSTSASTAAVPASLPTLPSPSPAKRRPKPPAKGILKPPPPPAKPTLGNRLRDIVGGAVNTAVGTTTRLFDAADEAALGGPGAGAAAGVGAGPSTPSSSSSARGAQRTAGSTSGYSGTTTAASSAPLGASSSAPGGTLASISGRLAGLGLSRFVATAAGAVSPSAAATSTGQNNNTPTGSPMPARSISLPEAGTGSPMSTGPSGTGTTLLSEKSKQKQPLKRATFVLPSLSITYPISSAGEPWSAKVIEDRARIESTHRTLLSASTGPEYWTSQRLVTLYESACRGREERPRVGIVRALEVTPPPPKPRHIHLILRPVDHTTIGVPVPASGPNTLDTPLTRYSAESFSDVLSAEWGLLDLKLEGGVIETEDALKPILHALLISGTLPVLSLSGNKKIKAGGWRLLAVFLKRARSLRYIDLSDTTWDKKGVEYLVQALTCTQIRAPSHPSTAGADSTYSADSTVAVSPENEKSESEAVSSRRGVGEDAGQSEKELKDAYGSFIPPAPLLKETDESRTPAAVQTLRMDGCGLKAAVLETLAQGVRSSDIKNISLRRNRIGPLGAVALALMIRDYPDSALAMSSLSPALNNSTTSMHSPSLQPNNLEASPNPSSTFAAPPQSGIPYAARTRGTHPPATGSVTNNEERDLPPIPLVVSSATGGVTSRTVPEGYRPPPPPKYPLVMPGGGNSSMQDAGNFSVNQTTAEGKMTAAELGGASMALQRSVRALDGVERIGRLLTLDLKSNEIKNGVNYIAQVLKRNRTLKVLNLSDNRIEASGLTALAEALKYNSSLETLDLSSNPCCGPTGEGIAALRTAFTVNTSLKRLFLADTGLTTDGAISLAEFLPESKSLLHLDLTGNTAIDTAGILAISVGLRSNKLIRCLDISIPPNSPDLAELSQHILQSCIRNTELAAAALSNGSSSSSLSGGGASSTAKAQSHAHASEAIWGPIKKSELVRQVKEADSLRAERERVELAQSPEGVAREYVYTLRPERVVVVSEEVVRDLQRWVDAAEAFKSLGRDFRAWEPGQLPKEDYPVLYERAKVLRERIVDQIQETTDSELLERLLSLNDMLTSSVKDGKHFKPPPRLLLPSQIVPTLESPQPIHIATSNLNAHGSASGGRYTSPLPSQRAFQARRHMRISSTEISSPNFSIGDSDNDSDAEELDVGSFENRSTPTKPAATKRPSHQISTPTSGFNNSNRDSDLSKDGLGLGSIGRGLGVGVGVGSSSSAPPATRGQSVSPALSPGILEKTEAEAPPSSGLLPEGTNSKTDLDFLEDLTSPTERTSRAWVEEEGEIFRKGMKLGVATANDDEDDDDDEREGGKGNEEVSGEELRKEILETPVARSPTRRVIPVEGGQDDEQPLEDEGGVEGDRA